MAGVEEGSRHRRCLHPVPPLRQAGHPHTPPPAATTLMEATCPASSMKHTLRHAHAHTLRNTCVTSHKHGECLHTHTHTQKTLCLLPQAHLHRLSQSLKHSQPLPPHQPLATTHTTSSHTQLLQDCSCSASPSLYEF